MICGPRARISPGSFGASSFVPVFAIDDLHLGLRHGTADRALLAHASRGLKVSTGPGFALAVTLADGNGVAASQRRMVSIGRADAPEKQSRAREIRRDERSCAIRADEQCRASREQCDACASIGA
jgi:hypothetical protein